MHQSVKEDADLIAALSHLPLEIRRSTRSSRLTLRTRPGFGHVLLLAPVQAHKNDILAFAKKNSAWILRQASGAEPVVPFTHGAIIPIEGVPYQIINNPHERGLPRLSAPGDDPCLFVPGEAAFIQRKTTDFLKSLAKSRLTDRCLDYGATLGVRPARISIKDTTSRWGSCSHARALSFSWRLILAPPSVLDYLAAHETAHLVEMNHSPRFWKLVRTIHPAMEQSKSWLSANGADLHRYGRVA